MRRQLLQRLAIILAFAGLGSILDLFILPLDHIRDELLFERNALVFLNATLIIIRGLALRKSGDRLGFRLMLQMEFAIQVRVALFELGPMGIHDVLVKTVRVHICPTLTAKDHTVEQERTSAH
jgi:SNF family Na+-dependent transporter